MRQNRHPSALAELPDGLFVVTGGAGFIGSNIVLDLAASGLRVVVVDRLRSGEKWRNIAGAGLYDLLHPDALFSWLDSAAAEIAAIVHMGAISATTETDVDKFVVNNIRLSLDLWGWCARHGVRLIYASSAATYGDGRAGFADDANPAALASLRPLNAYGWSKLVADRRIAEDVARGRPVPPQWAGLKFFNVYGPNEREKGDMQSVASKIAPIARAGQPVTLFRSHNPNYPDGGQLRDFVYVKDCVATVRWLLETPSVSGLFNCGSGTARSFADMAAAVFAAVGSTADIRFVDMPPAIRDTYQYFTQAEMGKLRAAGFGRPFYTLEEGIRDYLAPPTGTAG
jgi:ADP-L-glycero-D-manno-heptose 6-epimerase